MKKARKDVHVKKQKGNTADQAGFTENNGVMIVNGAVLEGGGQILRNTVALAGILGKKLCVQNIRANRPRGGGLRPQHLSGLELCAQLYRAKTQGLAVGSSSITFEPAPLRDDLCAATSDTKTAGSVCLLAQVGVPACLFSQQEVTLTLRGGTNATQAPPCDYFLRVLVPSLAEMGVHCNARIRKRGFFPKGGGEMVVTCGGLKEPLKPIRKTVQGKIVRVVVAAYHTGGDVADRSDLDRGVLEKSLHDKLGNGFEVEWDIEHVANARDSAMGVTVLAHSDSGCIFGFSDLCEGNKGERLQNLIKTSIAGLIRNIGDDHIVCVDEYLQDQLVIFMALAKGTSCINTGPITLHTRTAIYFCQSMTKAKFSVYRIDNGKREEINVEKDPLDYEHDVPTSRFSIECVGIGFLPKHEN